MAGNRPITRSVRLNDEGQAVDLTGDQPDVAGSIQEELAQSASSSGPAQVTPIDTIPSELDENAQLDFLLAQEEAALAIDRKRRRLRDLQAERQRLARVSPIPAQLDPDAIIAGLEQVEPVTLGRERSVMAAVPGTSLPEEVVITRALPSEAGIT